MNDAQSASAEFEANQNEPLEENEYGLMVSDDRLDTHGNLRSETIENEQELDDEEREGA